MNGSNNQCAGFLAHSINPNRCRRCFKDLVDHQQKTNGPPEFGSRSPKPKIVRKSFSDADKASITTMSSTTPSSSSSSLANPNNSTSATFTIKPKKVSFEPILETAHESSDASPNVEFTISVKKPRKPSIESVHVSHDDYQSRISDLSLELSKSKERILLLETKNRELENMRKTIGKVESREVFREKFDENAKLKQRIEDLERALKSNTSSSTSSRFGSAAVPDSHPKIVELNNKLKDKDTLIQQLTFENDEIRKDVKNLEIELQELHDNFHEDQSVEFRQVKRELESLSKQCRVMQFKLKKADRTIEQLEGDKADLEKRVQELNTTARIDVDKRRMAELENELKIAKEVSMKLHAEIQTLRDEQEELLKNQFDNKNDINNNNCANNNNNNNKNSPRLRPKLSPSPSFDAAQKDYEQVVRDLYDTMERERDLQEQLKFAEEETRTTRKKLSTMEQENEILMMQIRKMTSKNSSSSSNNNKNNNKKNSGKDSDSDSEELSPEELKLHLELYEQEMIVLRRKTDELEQENENFQSEIKYLQEKLISQPITKLPEIPELPAGSPPNVIYDHKIRLLEGEARELRKKLVDREKENESLRTEIDLHRKRASKVISRSRSLDTTNESQTAALDHKKQLQLFEQEATILRQKLIGLESDNEKLVNENKRLNLRISKKPPPGPADQLQIENLELKDRVKDLERKCDSLKTDLMESKLNGERTETETDFIASLKRQLRTKEQDLIEATNKAAQLDVDLGRINREYKKLKDALQPKRRVPRVIREAATRLELKEIIKEIEDELAELQTSNRAKDVVIENLHEDLSELKRENAERSHSNNGQANTSSTNNNNNNRNNNNQNVTELLQKIKCLEAKLARLSSTNTGISELSTERDRLAARVQQLEHELQNSGVKGAGGQGDPGITIKFEQERTRELQSRCDALQRELERVQHRNDELSAQLERKSFSSGSVPGSALERQLEAQKKSLETKFREESEQAAKRIRQELTKELQTLREEVSISKTKNSDLSTRLEQAAKEARDAQERLRAAQQQARKEREEAQERVANAEHELKSEQRRREKAEKEVENAGRAREQEVLEKQEKLVQVERDYRRLQAKIDDMEYDFAAREKVNERELQKVRQEYDDLTARYELLEKDFVSLKSKAVQEKETLLETVTSLKKSYEDKTMEIKKLKESSLNFQKEWYKEKLTLQERVAALEALLNKSKLFEEENQRIKGLLAEKENLLNSYRKDEQIRTGELNRYRKRIEEMQAKIAHLESLERNQRFMSVTGRNQVDKELQDAKIRLEHSETSHKGELAALHAEYESRTRLLGEEVDHQQAQIKMLVQERDRLKEQLVYAGEAREKVGVVLKDEVEDLTSQLRTLRSDLEGALLENRNLKIQHGTEKSSWQIQLAELRSQINQYEEKILLESRGTTRNYARTKMEIAWEKERQENQRLLQETQRFIQELRDKLIGAEDVREKERQNSKVALQNLKIQMDKEQMATHQRVAELHFDLVALKEAHARARSQNDRLRKERNYLEQSKVDFLNEEIAALGQLQTQAGSKSFETEVKALQTRLKNRLDELIKQAQLRSVNGSELSIASRLGNGRTGSVSSIASGQLPLPGNVKRAPPRLKSLSKKSLSFEGGQQAPSQDKIWDSDAGSLASTPNSSISNLRAPGVRYAYAGYESDSSAGSLFNPGSGLRPAFSRESSLGAGGGSDTDASTTSGMPKKSLKEKLKLKKRATEEEAAKALKAQQALRGFEMSPLEMQKAREKKEKSLRYKISKTLSKTFSRSTQSISGETESEKAERSKSPKRSKSPSRAKSPSRKASDSNDSNPDNSVRMVRNMIRVQPSSSRLGSDNVYRATITTSPASSSTSGYSSYRPIQSSLAIPPARRSPPKIRIPSETNV